MKTPLLLVMTMALSLSACSLVDKGEKAMEKTGKMMEEGSEKMMDTAGEAMDKTGEMMEEGADKMMEVKDMAEETMMAKSATYMDYEPAAGEGKKHVLFFHAEWCGTCVKWEKNLNENMETVTQDALILKADYDTMGDLAKQYEVTKQSTAVFINADGSVAKTEMDPSLESVNAFFIE